jgi:hypothetical protein
VRAAHVGRRLGSGVLPWADRSCGRQAVKNGPLAAAMDLRQTGVLKNDPEGRFSTSG